MAVHVAPFASVKIALGVWIYSGVADDARAHFHRLDYDGTCFVTWYPLERRAYIQGLSAHGTLTHKDFMDVREKLHEDYGVEIVEWERARGKQVKNRRIGKRRWVSCKT